ncbi:hypothetical protein SK128_021931, partial [Halocaridina rubra]
MRIVKRLRFDWRVEGLPSGSAAITNTFHLVQVTILDAAASSIATRNKCLGVFLPPTRYPQPTTKSPT